MSMNFEQVTKAVSSCETDVVNTLNSTRPEAQEEFLTDDSLTKPNNELGKLNTEELKEKLERLDEVEEALESSQLTDKEQRAIKMAIDINRRRNEFCLACAEYRANPNEETAAAQKAANEALYGTPDYNTYQALLHNQLEIISERELSDSEQVMYNELMELLKESS